MFDEQNIKKINNRKFYKIFDVISYIFLLSSVLLLAWWAVTAAFYDGWYTPYWHIVFYFIPYLIILGLAVLSLYMPIIGGIFLSVCGFVILVLNITGIIEFYIKPSLSFYAVSAVLIISGMAIITNYVLRKKSVFKKREKNISGNILKLTVILGVSFFLIISSGTPLLIRNITELPLKPYNELTVKEDNDLTEMSLEGVRIDTYSQMPVILLKEKDGDRFLPIWIGVNEAYAIALELSGQKTPRPITHDLIVNMIKTLKVDIHKVIVTDIKEDTYYAEIILIDEKNRLLVIDSRPSDAIAVAIRVKSDIFVANHVLDSKGIRIESPEDELEEFRKI